MCPPSSLSSWTPASTTSPSTGLPNLAAEASAEIDRTVADWLRLLHCAVASPRRLHSFPDFSSPVNAAIMLVRPDLGLYHEGLEVLREAGEKPFDRRRGWESKGRPQQGVSPASHPGTSAGH